MKPSLKLIKTSIVEFIETPASPRPLAVFRIGICILALIQVILLSNNLLDLYGSHGLIQWVIGEEIVTEGLPRISWFAYALSPFDVTPDNCVYILHSIYVASLIGLLLGWQTRIMAIIAWFSHFTMSNSGNLTAYGVDTFTHISLFYCALMPVGATLSLDNLISRKKSKPSIAANISLKVLQLYLCIVYLSTGLEKAAGIQWWNGEAIWRSIMQPQFAQVDMTWLASVPWLAMIICWSVLIIEVGYAFLIWHSKTRSLWVILTISLHLGIGMFLGLWLFAGIMILLTFSAFGWEILEKFVLSKHLSFPKLVAPLKLKIAGINSILKTIPSKD